MYKRSASQAVSGIPSPAKKRKTDGVQKYYAVRSGFRPGVYLTYAECSAQTAGFKGAIFKSFISREDAESFVAGRDFPSTAVSPVRFYAVASGHQTGIFTDWDDVAAAIKGAKGPKYKKFNSRAEAAAYIRDFGTAAAIDALKDADKFQPATSDEGGSASEANTATKSAERRSIPKVQPATQSRDDVLVIYTDGSSLANGQKGSRAGLGVYFGDGDARNVAERLRGEPQTNQRAELMAILRALEVAPRKQAVKIVTDSQYSINCVTQWAESWKRKGWVTATGEKVKNQDIIRAVLDKISERTAAKANTSFQWVKGHAADYGNIAADKLAVRGAKMA